MNEYGKMLTEIINSISGNYQKNELAFLTLTSKIENPLRDKIAFEFQKKIGDKKLICREWVNKNDENNKSKADIAILNKNGELECVIEFKAHSSMKNISQWSKSLIDDVKKNQKSNRKSAIIFVLFANYIEKLPDDKIYINSIKYYENLLKATKLEYKLETIKNQWKKALKKRNIKCELTNITIDTGKYENQNIKIQAFIHENITF
ncbi:MAG TPA: hypothetical protein DDZ39_01140 [Flavobacteriaceae bacterium]|jgi:hypothetical protein|nr:hypothetical protein [Flavobacteriaceae bacterium]HBS12848.1 hypothetical protein [Flavobacteriaceae bacterium]